MSGGPALVSTGSALGRLVEGINRDFTLASPDIPHAVRHRLRTALEGSDLYLDSARLLLSQLVSEPETESLYFDPGARYTLQVFCWPPGFGNEPHLHTNWNVSGVMAGSLLVFRSAISEADCLASQPVIADMGQAGVLFPPQFHCLRNLGDEPAITFHVFSLDSAADRLHLERAPVSLARIDDDGILTIATEAARRGGMHSIDIVASAFLAAGNLTKLKIVKLMVDLDPREAVRMGKTLSRLVGGNDGRRLLHAIEKLQLAAGQGQ